MVIEPRAVEELGMNSTFWKGKRVLITGHTGFKGSWLSMWLQKTGAEVAGFALPAPEESLFQLAGVAEGMNESVYDDIRAAEPLMKLMGKFHPEIVFHLAAQPIVRVAYEQPVETYHVNVMGTANLLESVRLSDSCRAVVVITSDKCYENKEWVWGYRESDPLGGHDPYSSSKACAELVAASYRHSFFHRGAPKPVSLASARAGNVIGGGDFSRDRLVPDLMAALLKGIPLKLRFPHAVRPWQHVLEPLSGYLLLAERIWNDPERYAEAWNFGPTPDDLKSVQWIVNKLNEGLGRRVNWNLDTASVPHEATLLALDSAKARLVLGWKPRWPLERTLEAIIEWYKAYESGASVKDTVIRQIESYEASS